MTCSNRRHFFLAFATLLLICLSPVQADEQMDTIRKRGRLQVAVYNNFPLIPMREKALTSNSVRPWPPNSGSRPRSSASWRTKT